MATFFSIRSYKPGDEKEIIQLLIHGFEGWPHFDLSCTPLDHWKWKFIDNPYRRSIVLVAENDDRIIGCTHGIFSRIKIGDKTFFCSPGADSAVHEDFRRHGVLQKLHAKKREAWFENNVDLVYGASSNKHVINAWKKQKRVSFPHNIVNFIRVRDVDLLLRNIKAQSSLEKQFTRYAIHLSKTFNILERLILSPSRKPNNVEVSNLDRFDDSVGSFWSRIKDDHLFITERSSEYLNWRYRDPRGGDYIVMQAVVNGEMVGYVALRINRFIEDFPQGYIVDLCTQMDRLDYAEALVGESVRFFDDVGVNVVYYDGVKSHPFFGVLKRFGFLDSRRRVNVTYSRINMSEGDEAFKHSLPKNILFQYGDFDWI